MRILFFLCLSVFIFSLSPYTCHAFSITPSAADVPFSSQEKDVEQVISITNTEGHDQEYTAEVKEVVFDVHGNIAQFLDIPMQLDVHVDPSHAVLASGESQAFSVLFSHPELVTSSQVFALYIQEKSSEGQEVANAYAALLFPQGISSSTSSFRIDAFEVYPEDIGIHVVAQFTNTGNELVRPMSVIVVKNRFGRELGRYIFAQNEGRLPVGTTRTVSSVLPTTMFGMWHVGGNVQMTLVSVADAGGEIQQATVMYTTSLGKGYWMLGGVFALIFLGALLFLLRRRGILHM